MLLLLSACLLDSPESNLETRVFEASPRSIDALAVLPAGTPLSDATDQTERFRTWTRQEDQRDTFPRGYASGQPPPRSAQVPGRFEVRMRSPSPLPTPVVHEQIVLTSGGFHGEQVYAYAHRGGEPLWGLNLSDDGPSTAACEGGLCVFNTESCTVFVVDIHTGEQRWSWYLGDPQLSAPTVSKGVVYTSYPVWGNSDATHVIGAFDLQTGDPIWQTWLDADVMSAPVVTDGGLFLSTFAGTVVSLDPKTGHIRGAYAANATSAPVVLGDAVWFSRRVQRGGEVFEVLAGAGALGVEQQLAAKPAPWLDGRVQRSSSMGAQGAELDMGNGFGFGGPQAIGGAQQVVGQANVSTLQAYQGSRPLPSGGLQISTMGDEVIAVDITTGATRWTHALEGDLRRSGGALGTAPISAGDSVLVGTLEGEILVLNPIDGRVRKTYTIGHPIRSQPVVQDGWIYVGTADGCLIGLDTGDASLTGWTHWGRDAARTGVAG